jgi:hypothetical protein
MDSTVYWRQREIMGIFFNYIG